MKWAALTFATVVMGATGLLAENALSYDAVRFDQHLGAKVPLTTEFTDTAGVRGLLGSYFRGKPMVLYFGYARCPQLCAIVADSTVAALRQIRPEVGRDFSVVSVSIDPNETALEAKHRETEAVRRYGHPSGGLTGWNFLTGNEASIRALTDAVGFHFVYDPRSRQYAHPSGFVVLTPEGMISRYFLGIDFAPAELAQALTQAQKGNAGSRTLELLLLCFRGEEMSGRYGTLIWRVLGGAVALTVIALAGGIGWMLRQERCASTARESPPC
jgi:protein SCO1